MKRRLAVSMAMFIVMGACSSTTESVSAPPATAEPESTTAPEPEPEDPLGIESASAAFDLVMQWLAGAELTEIDYEALFDSEFRGQVPYAQVVVILEQLSGAGAWRPVENQVLTETELTTVIEASAEDAERLLVQLAITDGQISTLFFGPTDGEFESPDTVEAAVARLADLGTLRYGVFDLSDGRCATVSGEGIEEAMPLGSMFKLYVLFAVQLAVGAAEFEWSDPVTIRDELDSFPSGTTQDVEAGATLTVRELAELMISISDNTATDHLIDLVGRDAVESAVVASGHTNPELLMPFLSTREIFVLKTAFNQAERDAYLATVSDSRRQFLDTTVAQTPLPALEDIVWPAPIDIDTIEWFASPLDICRVLSALTTTPETRAILAINPGPPSPAGRWDYVGFKGGSEPGVLATSWFVESPSGESYVVTGSVTSTQSAFAETEPINLFAAIRDLTGGG